MPNWCQNKLEITFPRMQGETIRQTLFSTNEEGKIELDFNKLIPLPDELLNTPSVFGNPTKLEQQYQYNIDKFGYKDWYDWSIANWGTKWNATSTFIINDDEESLSLYFDTAWSPPIYWFQQLCSEFPDVDLTLSYYEPGMWFAGSMQSWNEDCFHTEIDDIKQFAIDVFDEVFEDDE